MFLPVFVCLSVCLLARLLENACIDLNEMLRVDRCRNIDELINFSARSASYIVRIPEPDYFLRYRIGYGTLQPSLYSCQQAALLRGIIRRENPTYNNNNNNNNNNNK